MNIFFVFLYLRGFVIKKNDGLINPKNITLKAMGNPIKYALIHQRSLIY